MYRRDDPRLRRTLDQLTHNVEAATEHAQENLYTFSQRYINPCLSSFGSCFGSCIEPCLCGEEQRWRRQRTQPRGRAEASFDFYDDWEEEENDALLGWGNSSDELNRLLAGPAVSQPGREGAMSYGATQRMQRKGDASNLNIIPASRYLGFMDRLPWRLRRKGLRYKPSAADLREHPGVNHGVGSERESLVEDHDEDAAFESRKTHGRKRSSTITSGHTTTDSLSSRGDLFLSDGEDDAIPLDDEFAMALERRTTGSGLDDGSSGKPGSNRSKSGSRISRTSSRAFSSRSLPELDHNPSISQRPDVREVPPFSDLDAEEVLLEQEEESLVEEKRAAATRLAQHRGLNVDNQSKLESRACSPPRGPVQVDSKSPCESEGGNRSSIHPASGCSFPLSSSEALRQTEEAHKLFSKFAANELSEGGAFIPAALPSFSSTMDR